MTFPLIEQCQPIGYVVKPYGGNGTVIVALKTIESDELAQRKYVLLDIQHKLVPFFIEECFCKNNNVYLKFSDIHSVDDAETIAGMRMYIEQTDDVENDDDHDLVSYTLFNAAHVEVGEITSVLEYPMQLLLEVETAENTHILIPLVDEWIVEIDEQKRSITMNIPEGLLGLNE
ncbi:MAG: ribosome maturation factor RimM [Bacteroidales bacterium]|jgi:16S rRNA processing protein RimM|nr:ribosome maturation factor RimM [Bacteroidales bacterium]